MSLLLQAHTDHARARHEQGVHRDKVKIIFECCIHKSMKTRILK